MKIGDAQRYYRFLIVLLVAIPVQCFVPTKMRTRRASAGITSSRIEAARTRKDAELLPLTSFDRRKFDHIKTRGRVMPIIVMGEAILPGQRLHFRSGDPKFEQLINYIAQREKDYANSRGRSSNNVEIGILGFNPENGQPLYTGVTALVETKDFAYSLTAQNSDRAITTSFKGDRIFRLAGDPWMDPTGSFHMAHVEVLDGRYDDVTYSTTKGRDIQIESDELFAMIPEMVDEWMELMFKAGLATPASLLLAQRELTASNQQQHQIHENVHMKDLRHIIRRRNNNYALYPPRRQTERAIWVAALLNPIRRYPVVVSEEIRPQILACRNDRDRLDLCVNALRTSIGFLKIYVDAKKRGGQEKGDVGGV